MRLGILCQKLKETKVFYLKAMTIILVFNFLGTFQLSAQEKTPIYTKTYINDTHPVKVEVNAYKRTNWSDKTVAEVDSDQRSSLLSACNFYSEISIENLTQGAPVDEVGCQNNDSLELCFRVFVFESGGTAQYFHGLVPDFGDCLDVYPTPDGEPGYITQPMTNNTFQGQWQWFPDGVVTYNDIPNGYYPPYEPVGAGWFYNGFISNPTLCNDPANPNCSWGDGNGHTWEVCFLASPICTTPGIEFCEVSFRTFSDGETGGWVEAGCQDDQPIVYDFVKTCCEEPVILNETTEFEVCSGETFTLQLHSDMDPETTYDWYALPNPHGATSGTGNVINDVLTNFTDEAVTVTYIVTPTCAFGCIGEQLIVTVTIFPQVVVETFVTGNNIICDGECTQVEVLVYSPSPYVDCVWSIGTFSTSVITVCQPGYYGVTVTDANGCTGEAGSTVGEIPPIEAEIVASATEACENGSDFPITLTAFGYGGYGVYGYYWSNGSTDQSIIVTESGNYSVEVFDIITGCDPDYADISIAVFPTPTATISGPGVVCINEGLVCYQGNQSVSQFAWGGVADENGCIDPAVLGPGTHILTYQLFDSNGCEAEEAFQVQVLGFADQPEQLPDISFCENGGAGSYAINAVQYASSYEWTVTGSGSIAAGQGSTSIEVDWAGVPGGTVCVSAISDCGFSDPSCFEVEIMTSETADFEITPIICEDDVAGVIYNGGADHTWDFNWDFDGGYIVNGNSVDSDFEVQWASPGQYTVTLTVEKDGCISEAFSQPVQVDQLLETPQINCNATLNSIEFFWDEVPGVNTYVVNGQTQSGTSFIVTGLASGETVGIDVEAVGSGACGSSYGQANCTTQDCPATIIQLTPVAIQCQDNPNPIALQTNEPGGQWSGPGIIDADAGIFDPTSASPGMNTITYMLSNGSCSYSSEIEIEVEESLAIPIIDCNSTTEEVNFTWSSVAGATGYLVNGVLQTGTSFQMSDLSPDETVGIIVEAIGNGACGNSFAQSTCITETCPSINLQITEIDAQCHDDPISITLQTNEPGGQWFGPGIIDADAGIFDPTSASPGMNTITYMLSNGSCSYSSSLEIEVEEPLAIPIIDCNSTTEEVNFNWSSVAGATGYLVNGVLQTGTSFQMSNLSPGETVDITVEAIGSGACGNSFAQSTCITETCPSINLQITEVDAQCQDDPNPIALQINEPGGQWSGPGIIDADAGIFDPTSASPGMNTITYMLSYGSCSYSSEIEIEVEEPLAIPIIDCNSTTEEVNFTWSSVAGATGYLVNGALQTGTSFQLSNLSPGETVGITVEAIGSGVCGNSFAQSTCITETCPSINLQITEIDAQCQDDPNSIVLQINEPGGQWSGPGIIDADAGIFDPTSASPGMNTITYMLSNGSCSYSSSLEIEVEESLAIPIIDCNSTTDEVNFNWSSVAGATGYLVNGVLQTGTSFQMSNLSPGETVNITVEAVGVGACGSSFVQGNCSAQTCPSLALNIHAVQDLCLNALPSNQINLEVDIQGGTANGMGIWSGSGIIDPSSGIFDPNASNIQNGANEVWYTFEDGACIYTESILINVFTPPTVEAGTGLTLDCNLNIANLLGSGDGEPMWEGPGLIFGMDTDSPMINAPGIYTLTRTDPVSGCTASDFVEVFEDLDTPIAAVGDDQLLTCASPDCQLISIGNTADHLVHQWSGPGINTLNVNDSAPIVDVPGTYTLSILNTENGCVSPGESIEVIQNIISPLVGASMNGSLDCSGSSVLIEIAQQPGVSYQWSSPDGSLSNGAAIDAVTEGLYVLTATNTINGCTATEEVTIENTATHPIADAGENKEITCLEMEVSLNGENSQTGNNMEYLWSGPVGGISGPADQLEVNATLEGMYILSVVDVTNSCITEDTVYVTSNTEPPMVDAGLTQEFGCNDQSLLLEGTASTGNNDYIWLNENEEVIALNLDTEITSPGWYTLQVTNTENGCIGTDAVFISVNEDVPYGVSVLTKGESCYGDEDGSIEIEGVEGGIAPYQYSFDGQSFTDNIDWQSLDGGTYNLIVQDSEGCIHEETIMVPDAQEMVLDLGPDIVMELGQSHPLNIITNLADNSIDAVYWTPSESVNCVDEDCLSVLLSPMNTTTFEVTLVDSLGCETTEVIMARVKKNRGVFIPNIFTPNDDGINDRFYIQGIPSVKQVNYFRVFDRWGELLFENDDFNINDESQGWDGFFKNEKSQTGTYLYMAEIEFVDGFIAVFKGDVTLVR